MKMLFSIFAILFSGFVSGYEYSGGEASPRVVRVVEGCFDLGGDEQVNLCVEGFYAQSAIELESAIKRVRDGLKVDADLFDRSQQAWLAFRRAECDVQSVSSKYYRNPEYRKVLFSKACAVNLNDDRARNLNKILVGCDACLK